MDNDFLTIHEVMGRVPLRRTALWRYVAQGRFPKPIRFANRALWRAADVAAFLAELDAQAEAVNGDPNTFCDNRP